jgi:YidC/Oxa1 family membrane protein insertase
MTIASLILSVSAVVFGFANPFAPIFDPMTHFFAFIIDYINGVTHNYGWSMLVLALVVRVALIPLYVQQFKSAKEMQALAPYLKRLQNKYKDNKQKLQEETLALYREHGVNPLGGCLPLLVQLPILWAVYQAIRDHNDQFKAATWAWIGSPLSLKFPHILATNLAQADQVLLLLYAVSLYFSVRLTPTPNIDPQQAQMMKINSLIMPVALFFFLRGYPSAFILYWLGFNVISMTQQWIIMRAPSRIGAPPAETPATLAGYPLDCPSCNERLVVIKGSKCEKCGAKVRKVQPSGNGAANAPAALNQSGGGAKQGS